MGLRYALPTMRKTDFRKAKVLPGRLCPAIPILKTNEEDDQ
jgi:hypothetical protein